MGDDDDEEPVRGWRRWRAWLVLAAVLIVLPVLRPALHLSCVAVRESRVEAIAELAGPRDFGRRDSMDAVHTVTPEPPLAQAELAVKAALARAHDESLPVAIAGARHSMGGQTMNPRGIYLDMRGLRCVRYDPESELVHVCAGTKWAEVVDALAEHGRAVKVMQSNSDFSVGGTVSVNAHGWQNGMPPVGATVRSLRVVRADGTVVDASRDAHEDLFRHVVGGYGLFGVILEATLETVPDVTYRSVQQEIATSALPDEWQRAEDGGAELIYGRLSIAREGMLEDALVMGFYPTDEEPEDRDLTDAGWLARLVFRGAIDSEYGKELRWDLERWFGGEAAGVLRRSAIQSESADWFVNRDRRFTDVLHEYFVPKAGLGAFLADVARICTAEEADALNMTVRSVSRDVDSALPYAREDVFAVVMFFHEAADDAGEERQRWLTSQLIEAAIDQGGSFYLPYRLHATPDQVRRAYPSAEAFFSARQTFDPEGIFDSYFAQVYGG